jgi:hypothetical protein
MGKRERRRTSDPQGLGEFGLERHLVCLSERV